MAGRRDTGRNRMAARSVVLAGVLVMVVAGWQAMAYFTFLDPDDVCTVHHLCDEAANTAALHALSWWTAGGFVVVCLGLGWIGWLRHRTAGNPGAVAVPRGLSAAAHGALAALSSGALLLLGSLVVFFALFLSPQMFAACVTALWLARALALDLLHRACAPADSPVRRFAVSLLAGGAGLLADLAVMAWGTLDGGFDTVHDLLLLVLDACLVYVIVTLVRLFASRSPEAVGRPRVWASALSAVVAMMVAAGIATSEPAIHRFVAPPPSFAEATTPVPAPTPAPELPSSNGTAPPSPPQSVDTDVRCLPGDLTLTAQGWDAAMGTRAVTVVANNASAANCYVEGFAGLHLTQRDIDLQLQVTRSTTNPNGAPVVARRIGIAPSGRAVFPVLWKGYSQQAGDTDSQGLTVSLDGAAGAAPVDLSTSRHRFDLIEGAEVTIGPWHAA